MEFWPPRYVAFDGIFSFHDRSFSMEFGRWFDLIKNTPTDFLYSEYLCVKSIGRFWGNFSHFPDRSFSTEFSIPSICRFRWNFGNHLVFKYYLFKQYSSASHRANKESFPCWGILSIRIFYQYIFWRPTPDKKRRFGWNLGETKMSFWVEFGEIQYVISDGILPKIKN